MNEDIAQVFTDLGRQMRRAAVLRGLAAWVAIIGGGVLLLCIADTALHLPAALRLAASIALATAAGVLAWRWVLQPARTAIGAAEAALAAERVAGRDDNRWINAVQLAPKDLPRGMRIFAANQRSAAAALPIPTDLLLRRRALAWSAGAAVLVVGLWLLASGTMPYRLGNTLRRLVLPLADIPAVGAVRLRLQPAEDVELTAGSDLPLELTIDGAATARPVVIWAEGASRAPEDAAAGGVERLPLEAAGPGRWSGRLSALQRGGAVRALCGDSATPSLRVTIVPPPRLVSSRWVITPPPRLGEPPRTLPGPPAPCAAVAGSRVTLRVVIEPQVPHLVWTVGSSDIPAQTEGNAWTMETILATAQPWRLGAIAQGRLEVEADRPPEVTLTAAAANGPNLSLAPGQRTALGLRASDDHGLRSLALMARDSNGGDATVVQEWTLSGPPGPRDQAVQPALLVDPQRFQPGHAYVLTAVARDHADQQGVSPPLMLRVLSTDQVAPADPQDRVAMNALNEAIAAQRTALGLMDNLVAHATELAADQRLAKARDRVMQPQAQAAAAATRARDGFARSGHAALGFLVPLVTGEFPAVASALAALPGTPAQAPAIQQRQRYILERLLLALGSVAAPPAAAAAAASEGRQNPEPTVRALAADLDAAVRAQQRLLEKTRNLLAEHPADLSDPNSPVIGALAREEGELAAFMQAKLSDFSKLPPQDASDMSLIKDGEAVFQEMSKAAADLYAKKVELAVPAEQGGLELAKQLQHNLERWLASHPDNTQWKMEDMAKPADTPLAELPRELEDIVGDLLDDASKMDEGIEDVSSNWMDSLDKGAGWGAGDGPIANMSAKGVTGNQLPNNHEIGGRSGEGRSGRSSGQMVGDEAVGKGGRETPTRLSPGAFEQGSVKDSMKGSAGGATGGGKLSGGDAEGLRGPVPAQLQQAMQRLAGNHAQLQQQAGTLALRLRERHQPSAALETAAANLGAAAAAAGRGDVAGLRQRHDAAIDALADAKRAVVAGGLAHERLALDRQASGVVNRAGERVPPGYEQMAERYFQALAEER